MDHVIQYFDYFAFPFPVQKQSDVFVITIQHYDFLLLPFGEFKIHIHLLTKANIFKKITTIQHCFACIYGLYFQRIVLVELTQLYRAQLYTLQLQCFFQLSTNDYHFVKGFLS